MKTFLALLLSFFIVGCASFSSDGEQSAGPGQAVYHYKKTADSCEVTVTSAKDILDLNLGIDENCAVKAKAEAVSGEKMQMEMIETMGKLLDKL